MRDENPISYFCAMARGRGGAAIGRYRVQNFSIEIIFDIYIYIYSSTPFEAIDLMLKRLLLLLLLCSSCWFTYGSFHDSMSLRSPRTETVEPEICKPSDTTTEETLWIAVPAWNQTRLLEKCLDSIASQINTGFANIHVVVFEDYSNDMFTDEQKQKYDSKLEITYLSNNGPVQHGSAYGKWELFEYIRSVAKPFEYTMIVDGDDTLADIDTISYIYKRLKESKAWFAWGRHNGKYSEQCRSLRWGVMTSKKNIRNAVWSFCHPRMFQSHLLQSLTVNDFQRDNGEWLQKATDRPFIFKFMEIAGQDRIQYIGDQKALYNYTFDSRNGLKVFKKEIIQGDKDLVNHRSPAQRSNDVIHVISCVFDRQNTQKFLSKFSKTILPKDHVLKIHICNNSPERQNELMNIAKDVERESKAVNLSLTIDIVDMGGNHGGFSRFLLAKQLVQTEFIEYFIMVDDDQYVRPGTIANIYNKREPQMYKTWFGKTWLKNDRDYWTAYPRIISRPSIRALFRWDITHYQYGGTGMSIIDANIFLYKQLYELDEKYQFLEDIWLSHIVNIQGWQIARLFLFFDEEFISSVNGQYVNLKQIKNDFFTKINYFQCGTGAKVSREIETLRVREVVVHHIMLIGLLTYGVLYWKKRYYSKILKKN